MSTERHDPPGPDTATSPAPAAQRRRRAVLAGHEGDLPAARALLADPDPGVRAAALGALERLGSLTGDELAAAARDPAAAVRRRTAEALAVAPALGAALDDALVGLLADADPTVVEVAAWATGERHGADRRPDGAPPPDWVPTRLAALATAHDDALVREAAVAALGAVGDERGLPAILAATGDRATVRRRAVLALAPFAGPEVDAALDRATTDRDRQVRQAAEDLLDPDR
ncbi:MAG: HEAT repeat domain-containing protein [Acidimicrobiales bacterium]